MSLAGCASVPQPDVASGLSRLEASGNLLTCGAANPVCRAYPNFVDGQEVGMMQGSTDVKPGERRLHLICLSLYSLPQQAVLITGQPAPVLIPARDTVRSQRLVYAKLEAGHVYRVQGEWDGERCSPVVVDTATNQPIPLEAIVAY